MHHATSVQNMERQYVRVYVISTDMCLTLNVAAAAENKWLIEHVAQLSMLDNQQLYQLICIHVTFLKFKYRRKSRLTA